MDGIDCTGRRISLLNDSSDNAVAVASKYQPPSIKIADSREFSSRASTPSFSPQTPELVRSGSDDSERNFATPSPPSTPTSNSFGSGIHERLKHSDQQQYYLQKQPHAKMDDQNASMYPPIPDATGVMASAYSMPQQMPSQQMQPLPQANQQMYRASTSPSSEPSHLSTVSATSNSKAQQLKKNQYPCPMAKQVGCTDFFTTSGHAARHAKKHTGKKDAFCPECNKAFTRKDNMEQHRRTHQNGRSGASRSSNGDDSKVKKPTKLSTKKTGTKAESQLLEAAVEQQLAEQAQPVQAPMSAQMVQAAQAAQAQVVQQQALERAMMMPPGAGPYFLNTTDAGPIPALPNAMPDLSMRPPLHRSNFTNSLDYSPPAVLNGPESDLLHYAYPSPGLSNGLNSLALAASEHRRLSEEKTQSLSPRQSPSQVTPFEQT
ncbi:hypothetical protein LTR37_020495 [Vermiconidia calcicola]|uniref:Uncharacterized protein n=1 Tax=Vermiconidia calcicola TaxID=1690605 RepID=A0ACC3MD07_9PEZI|nr:hypothetical protein LTR37_020495 [Vermiconidia calcicola]